MQTLDHVAIAVPRLDEAIKVYESALGARIGSIQELPEHGVKVVFVKLANSTIELLEPLGENSPIAAFLARHPQGGIHHLCIGDSEFPSTLKRVQDQGIRALGEVKTGAHGNPVQFFHPKDFQGTLLELEHLREE